MKYWSKVSRSTNIWTEKKKKIVNEFTFFEAPTEQFTYTVNEKLEYSILRKIVNLTCLVKNVACIVYIKPNIPQPSFESL